MGTIITEKILSEGGEPSMYIKRMAPSCQSGIEFNLKLSKLVKAMSAPRKNEAGQMAK